MQHKKDKPNSKKPVTFVCRDSAGTPSWKILLLLALVVILAGVGAYSLERMSTVAPQPVDFGFQAMNQAPAPETGKAG